MNMILSDVGYQQGFVALSGRDPMDRIPNVMRDKYYKGQATVGFIRPFM
jgi:hypothetical protein